MEKQEIKDMMRDRKFAFNMEFKDGEGNTTSLNFISEPVYHRHRKDQIVVPSFNCTVYPKSGEFDFTYMVPGSINKLETPKCSPVGNEEHFNRICVKFESMVQVLYHAFGEPVS